MAYKRKIHFEVSERKILLRLCDLIFVISTLHFLSLFFEFDYFEVSTVNLQWTIVLSFYLLLFGSIFEMYNLQVASNQLQMIKSLLLTTFTTTILYLLTPILTPVLPPNRLQIILFFCGVFFPLLFWRLFYQRFLASHRFEKRVLLICNTDDCDDLVNTLEQIIPHYKILAVLLQDDNNVDQTKSDLTYQIVEQDQLVQFATTHFISEIVIATMHTERLTPAVFKQIVTLLDKGFIIKDFTHVYESSTYRIPMQHFNTDFYRYFPFSRNNSNQLYLFFVKLTEIILSLLGLAMTVFFIPFVVVGNFFGNKGSLFYSQTRVGKNGKTFEIYKFRTMKSDAEANGAVFSTKNDIRITPFGKFLRKSRIDELPQFFNILKGEMAFIGPRPERPYFVEQLAAIMPFYETRHVVKPGLTGWAQVNYSYGESIDESLIKLQYDLYYIKRRSLFLDLNIILKTISTILFYRGQ